MSMTGKSVVVMGWAAWRPGLFAKEDWKSFFASGKIDPNRPDPEVPDIPPLLRRRMTRTSRMSAAAAFACLNQTRTSAQEAPIVFSSRHGEMGALVEILDALARGEGVSPTAFSHSVHHTTASAFSIATGNTRELRSVAGCDGTFSYGFLDSLGLLNKKDNSRVLLLSSDDEVPEMFNQLMGSRGTPHAVALVLAREGERQGIPLRFHFQTDKFPATPRPDSTIVTTDALDFVQWLESSSPSFTLSRGGIQWVWTR